LVHFFDCFRRNVLGIAGLERSFFHGGAVVVDTEVVSSEREEGEMKERV
jgi:hypothetical protein